MGAKYQKSTHFLDCKPKKGDEKRIGGKLCFYNGKGWEAYTIEALTIALESERRRADEMCKRASELAKKLDYIHNYSRA